MNSKFRIQNSEFRIFGLLGWPLDHSISPSIHQAAFEALGLAGSYDLWPTPPDELVDAVRGLAPSGKLGSNVTIPHKQAVMPLMDELSDAARLIGAVNTIIVRPDGRLRGDNSDWRGFLHPLDASGFDLTGKRVLLIGAGGAARAVGYALAQRKVAEIAIWNRSPLAAVNLANHLSAHFPGTDAFAISFLYQSANQPIHQAPQLIVNTTPLGMWPHMDASPWPLNLTFPPGALVYDLVYRPEQTKFLAQAEAAGCQVQGGLEMLVVQAAVSFEMWTGQFPPLDALMKAARAALDPSRRFCNRNYSHVTISYRR